MHFPAETTIFCYDFLFVV